MTDQRTHSVRERADGFRIFAVAIGAVGLAAAVTILFAEPTHFYQGYLVGFAFWSGASFGCMALLMLHHLVGGEWGFVTQRILEAGAATTLLMAAFVIPILFGMHEIYEWTHEDVVAASDVLQHKKPYLNAPFFIVRTILYFAAFVLISFFLVRWSRMQDDRRDPRYAVRLRRLSAGGLVVYVLLITWASLDWYMSISPHWFSTVYGWLIAVSQTLTALAVAIVALYLVRGAVTIRQVLKTKHFHDYGNLMLAFVVLWTYMMFAQYLIIWSGNIPEDVLWYVHRKHGVLLWVGSFLVLFHFAVPFFILLFRRTKRTPARLAGLAAALLIVHAVFLIWLILPSFNEAGLLSYVSVVVSLLGIGGCWLALFLSTLAARPLVPSFDPRFEETTDVISHAKS